MYDAFLKELLGEFPTLRLIRKDESRFMRFIAWLITVCTFGRVKGFLDRYTTTIGQTIYLQTSWFEKPEWLRVATLRHERVHLRQQRRYGTVRFMFLYLFVSPLFFAYYRNKFEREAYEETIKAFMEYQGIQMLLKQKDWILDQFTGPVYGWMWPKRVSMEAWFYSTLNQILRKEISDVQTEHPEIGQK